MIREKILELYNQRRVLLMQLLEEIRNVSDSIAVSNYSRMETHDLMLEMSMVSNTINEMCNNDYILVDMYRRLSLALAKENYEEASEIKSEINSHI